MSSFSVPYIIIQILYEYSNILHMLFTRLVYAVHTDKPCLKKGDDNFLFIYMLSIVIAKKPLFRHRGFFRSVLKIYMFYNKSIYLYCGQRILRYNIRIGGVL